ncbi:leucine-rich repeat-containing larval translucida [Rhynchophorus ferrugineus]|uniref:leucine-rich repeat-containing larval translucida n=1 Tax=Rhynchophorus ferrugineus TaxID=354439 RepID=UPI003FCE0AEA
MPSSIVFRHSRGYFQKSTPATLAFSHSQFSIIVILCVSHRGCSDLIFLLIWNEIKHISSSFHPHQDPTAMYRKLIGVCIMFLALFGAIVAHYQCPKYSNIMPCKCTSVTNKHKTPAIECEKMPSYEQVVTILNNHFQPTDRISLKLIQSNLQDLQYRSFRELNATIEDLILNYSYLGTINADTFDGLTTVRYISLADSYMDKLPSHVWRNMPYIGTVDLGRTKIQELTSDSFRDMHNVKCIVLPGNQISRVDRDALPVQIERLHLGRNQLYHLNDSLQELRNLRWLFLNENELEDLERQLPLDAPFLKLIHIASNRLTRVPTQLRNYQSLENVYLNQNKIETLDGILSKTRTLQGLILDDNIIHTITPEDFSEMERLDYLSLHHNELRSLNNSLYSLRNLNYLNVSYNLLTSFSFQEIVGLPKLKIVDLSHNQITQLTGSAANLVESNIKVSDLKLHNNMLETLNSALSGLSELLRLDLSYNRLKRISPDDLINLDQLRLLDISHNQITTLAEMSKTYLPRLQELKATHNYLTILEYDFHGLPVLCNADLSSNQIIALGRELVTKTRCKVNDGVHEAAWDVLRICLQDNPILCDAALPEITSEMETNHTRIYGVSHCPPLSEQPITPRLNAFLGYVPDQTSPTPIYGRPSYEPKLVPQSNEDILETPNQIQAKIYPQIREPVVELRTSDQYHTIDRFQEDDPSVVRKPRRDEPIAETLHRLSVTESTTEMSTQGTAATLKPNRTDQVYDPVLQGQVINKLVSEIEELKSKVEQLTTQNEMLLNKTTLTGNLP